MGSLPDPTGANADRGCGPERVAGYPRPHSKVAWAEAPTCIRLFLPGVFTQGLEVRPVDMQAKIETVGHS